MEALWQIFYKSLSSLSISLSLLSLFRSLSVSYELNCSCLDGKCGRFFSLLFFFPSNEFKEILHVLQSTSPPESVLYSSLLNVRKEDSN